MSKKKVMVAFSGGKDSAAAVMLLQKENLEVQALFMKIGLADEPEKEKKLDRLTAILGVPLRTVDAGTRFKKEIIGYFLDSYRRGLTPNPCIICNQKIKFTLLRDIALNREGADYYATGHYADCFEEHGKLFLKEPLEKTKSQIYFLSLIEPERLKKTIFPLSNTRVDDVRRLVRSLPLVNKHESQDVCFLQGINLMDYLRRYIPDAFSPGDIIDMDGNRIGTHDGIVYFTIGQRRGTRFSSGKKLYVIRKDNRDNTIMLGEEKHLFSDELKIVKPVFWKHIRKGQVFQAKVRYVGATTNLEILDMSESRISVKFEKPVRAITPGQICVLYERDGIVAAGHIE